MFGWYRNGEEKSKYGPYRESNLGGGLRGGHIHSHPHTHSTLPRAHLSGPNHGQYATLSKQCKTLESSDFYWDRAPAPQVSLPPPRASASIALWRVSSSQVSHIDGSFDTELDSYVFSTRTTLESIAPITSQDSFTQPVKTPDTFQSTISRQRDKSQESFYSGSKPMESFQQKASTLTRQPKTFEVPRVPDTYSKTLKRSKSKESHYEPFMFRAQQQQQQQQQAASVESAYQSASAKTPTFDKNDLVTDLPDSGYMITEL